MDEEELVLVECDICEEELGYAVPMEAYALYSDHQATDHITK